MLKLKLEPENSLAIRCKYFENDFWPASNNNFDFCI